jgi:hypothetical protein
MATANHVLLRRITLTASASSVTFDSIPQTGYTDLKLVASVRDDYASVSVNLGMKLNGVTTGLSGRNINGSGSAAASGTNTSEIGFTVGSSGTANTYSTTEVYIPNYTSSNYKSYSADSAAESNQSTVYMQMLAGVWANTAAITSIIVYPINATNFVAGSSFSLYGIANAATTPALAPKADGGDIIKTDGTYWYHAFTSTGLFKPQVNLTADYIVVAGGGGGGGNGGGGGGAGGVILASSASLANQDYVCSVGAGGAANSTNGGNSTFGALTAIGGGKGGGFNNPGTAGGSGGGGGMSAGASYAGGSATSGQGYAGGNGSPTYSSSTGGGGGGGGAGAVGTNAVNANPMLGAGGVGVSGATYSFLNGMGSALGFGQLSGGNYYFAGGGSGGPSGHSVSGYGGLGGGANFNASATPYTGGGGGAGQAYGSDSPGNGGSGIIIIRYPVA